MMFVAVAFCLLVASVTFLIHSFLWRRNGTKKSVYPDNTLAISIYDLVGNLGQQCPVGPTTKWSLKTTMNGVPCWKKGLEYMLVDKKFNIYGASIHIPSSAKRILSSVEDVNLWKAWNCREDGQNLKVQKLVAEGLACDKYMQYDQIIGKEPLYHRFGNTESNNVSWILLWHMHSLSWTFFLAQPIDDFAIGYSNQDHSVLTMIHCSSIRDIPQFISSSLVNINQFISISKVQLRPFCPSSPVISLLPAEPEDGSDSTWKNVKCHLLRQRSRSRSVSQLNQTKSSFFYTLVPFAYRKPINLRNLVGFLLTPQFEAESTKHSVMANNRNQSTGSSRNKVRARHRTFSTSSDVLREENSSRPLRSRSLLETTGQLSDPECSNEVSTAIFLKSMLFGKKLYKDLSADELPSIESESPTIVETNAEVDDAIPVVKDTVEEADTTDKDSRDGSRDASIEKPSDDSQKDMMKFKTVGNKCVADLLTEVIRASSIDLSSTEDEQLRSTGGWKYEGFSGKEVVSLVKHDSFCGMKTISYLSKGVIPATVEKVWKAVQNPLTRFTYDETVKKIIVLRKLNHGQKLLHVYHETSTILKKEAQDFCILQTERIENDKKIVAFQSVEFENCPFMHGVLRGLVLPSGWIIEGLPQDSSGVSCSVTYIVQMVVNVSNSLLLDEVMNTQSQCISNLRTYLCPDMT